MLIKFMQYTAVQPQRTSDLKRLLRYLMAGRAGDEAADRFVRLAGPPFTRRLIQRVMPFGPEYQLAADDLAHQFFDLARRGYDGGSALPRQIYVHAVLSFAPGQKVVPAMKVQRPGRPIARESTFAKAMLIVVDALENLGVGEHFPMFLVVHGDKAHLHAHVIIGLYVPGSPPCKVLRVNSAIVRSIARYVDAAYGLPRDSTTLKSRHLAIVDATKRRNA